MTGYSNNQKGILSKLTLATLKDLDFEVDDSQAGTFDGTNVYMDNTVDGCCKPPGSRKQLRQLQSNNKANSKRKPLSVNGRAKAIAHGQNVMKSKALSPWVPRENNGVVYVGDRFISVLIEEDGEVYEVGVSTKD